MKKIIYIFILLFMIIPTIVNAEAVTVSSYEELITAINNSNTDIVINNDIYFDSTIMISGNIKIIGNNKSIIRKEEFKESLFSISSNASLELNEINIDGKAQNWQMDIENRHYTQADNKGYVRVPTIKSPDDIEATSSLIVNSGDLILKNVSIKNAVCTIAGCAISGTGNNTINNSSFNHIGSLKNGGALSITGGTTTITDSKFEDLIAGYGTEATLHGGAIYVNKATLIDINNSEFIDNLAQSNGGALFLGKTNIIINNSIFKHNMCGNDGSAINLDNNTSTYYSLLIENSTFEKNHGLATTGQSMGTIWIGNSWNNPEDKPIVFRNLIFKQNIARTGGAVADNGANTYAYFENIEVFENEIGSGGFIYSQSTNYRIDGINIHDNKGTNGSGIYVSGANVVVDNAKINDNTTTGSGSGIYIVAGNVKISNSEISGNKTTEGRGGGIFVRGYYEGYNPVLVLENTTIKENESSITGGGICVSDNENVFSSITIDDQSKIYDNKAANSGDDFAYYRQNNSENTSNNTITLDNISIAGITGIDGWYHDNEGDRFIDTDNPSTFNNYSNYSGYGIYLKAAGISSMDFDLDGGSNNDIIPIEIRYGKEYTVTDEEPVKDGYEFTGWNTKADGTGITLNPGDKYDGKDGYVLYAQYRVIEITNPKTFDGINKSFIILIISTVLLSVIGLFKINRKINN